MSVVARSLSSDTRQPFLYGVGMAIAATASGCVLAAVMVQSQRIAVAAVAATVILTIGWFAPRPVLLAGILNLAWAPEFIEHGGRQLAGGQVSKSVVYLCAVPIILKRGVRPLMLAPVAAYVALWALSAVAGTPAAELTPGQSLSSFIALNLSWLLMAVRWRPDDRPPILLAIAIIPVLSIGLGVLLQAGGLTEVVRTDPATRLYAAMIPPYLGGAALAGFVAGLVQWRVSPRPLLVWLMVADVLILCATVSRGSLIGLVIAAAPLAYRFVTANVRRHGLRPLRVLTVGLALAGVLAVAVPAFSARNDEVSFVNGVGNVSDPTSGRSAAWQQFYAAAKVNILFGRGLGSGPVIHVAQQGFKAQHNEYLRLLVEGGYVGAILVIAAIAAAIASRIRRAPPALRGDLIALAIGFAVFSFVDNTLAVPQMAVTTALVFAMAAVIPRGAIAAHPPPTAPRALATA
jgi:teichuronic acid biosynthesis protein TuaE